LDALVTDRADVVVWDGNELCLHRGSVCEQVNGQGVTAVRQQRGVGSGVAVLPGPAESCPTVSVRVRGQRVPAFRKLVYFISR
jgi:hypothetical protein